ncbi:hypothetical protein TthAA37_21860 (plasmid) [Thermus thermophilus]|uniref:Uncharacterized protein n=1 Tax=Thermus thermophilus TaxID=274 RepID=A0AAD1KWB3_THETH|nr:hypothetical protein [Thermus thermophilus]BBL83373.1 hypothetical protein TthAA220_21570 [Thermus thermophilus]BBL85646.1 hypothetical protein TthAA229_21270 [Thermus thermophilus]BCZ87994.1 hypothetical protein TthAA11_21760 [Thermus thermophilus]BCZ90375.1 hypothetical protein TthAA22_21800 [Thermus thermophilus]BCZ92997.1 hypothetical protein TthAA37_21860 [Thermus thermophilus]
MRPWLRKRLPDLVALFALAGLSLTGVELLLMGHTEGVQLLAPLAAFLGAFLAGMGLALRRWALAFALALVLLAPVGLFGLFQHLEEALEAGAPAVYRWVDEEGEGWEEGREGEETPPPLAPLSLSGLALLAALGLYTREE